MAGTLTLYYQSGWIDPVLHYGFQDQSWSDATFKPVPGDPGWWQAKMSIGGVKMEFVPRAKDSSGWDNPPGGGNYHLQLLPDTQQDQAAVLCRGEVALLDLKRLPWALVADMDGTLIGDPEAVQRLLLFWDLNCRFARRPSDGVRLCQLAYNSGRNRQDMLNACRENQLPRPEFMICGVGTEIYRPCPVSDEIPWYDSPRLPEPDKDWLEIMRKEFGDREALAAEVQGQFPQLEIHGNIEHDPFRLPCMAHITPEDPHILTTLQAWGDQHPLLRVIISGIGDHRYVDICSVHADKGLAIEHLFSRGAFLGISDKSRILVAGDSGNDMRMYMVPGVRAVMVGNSQPSLVDEVFAQAMDPKEEALLKKELPLTVKRKDPLGEVYYAKGFIGDGVCEAIRHYYWT